VNGAVAEVFGGPDDGMIRQISGDDLRAGFIESTDAAGVAYRYNIVALETPGVLGATHRLVPHEEPR
jgi:hypothetical protein